MQKHEKLIIKLNEELEEKVNERTIELKQEKEKTQELLNKSDHLLLNILPLTIANRLKEGETTIADNFEASVVFIDIVDFTAFSKERHPSEVVEVLNKIYTHFDRIADKYGLEKIKTIGDCYMAAAGIPEPIKNHAEMATKFAIEALTNIDNDVFRSVIDHSGIKFRCGIDCGPIVAGVIGEKKFIYDLWGDTVNTASRMEEYSESGKIQVTERFKNKLINQNGDLKIDFEERGEIEIKGKGMMRTWFLVKQI